MALVCLFNVKKMGKETRQDKKEEKQKGLLLSLKTGCHILFNLTLRFEGMYAVYIDAYEDNWSTSKFQHTLPCWTLMSQSVSYYIFCITLCSASTYVGSDENHCKYLQYATHISCLFLRFCHFLLLSYISAIFIIFANSFNM